MKHIIMACLAAGTITIGGCATVPHTQPASIGEPYPAAGYHKVVPGETLWSISRSYYVDISDIIQINRISDASNIEVGQLLAIPSHTKPLRSRSASAIKGIDEGFMWPIKGNVTFGYGTIKNNVPHKGIDIEAKEGQEIVASRAGMVVFVNDKVKGLGKTIIIEHPDGYNTLYAHNAKNLVCSRETVTQNQPIAIIGTTGRVNRPTLHFQIRKGHKPQNPLFYLP